MRLAFRVVSWNLHALPRFLPWQAHADERVLRALTRIETERPDIVMLQEMWQPAASERFAGMLEGRGFVTLHPRGRGLGRGVGGLMMFARAAAWESAGDTRFYEFSNGGSLRGGDRFGNKGAMFARLRHESGVELTIANTHLQAQYGFPPGPDADTAKHGYIEIRKAQIAELARWLEAADSAAPILIAGDFNTFPTEWPGMLPAEWNDLTTAHRESCKCTSYMGDGKNEDPSWLDYLFLKLPRSMQHEAAVSLIKNQYLDEYSDHHGLSAAITIEPRPAVNLALLPLALMTGQRTRREWLAGLGATALGPFLKGLR